MRSAALALGLAALGLAAAPAARAGDPCAYWTPQPPPQNAGRDIVGQDIDRIRERGWMEFAVYEDMPPYSWEDGGTPRGVDIEIARIIAGDVGVEPRFRFVDAGETVEADLRNYVWKGPIVGGGVSNVMMRVPYDSAFACRVEQVVFTGQYATEAIAIAYREAAYPEEKPVPAYFRFDTVGVENDSISDFYLTSLAGGQLGANVRRYPATGSAMAALARGEVTAVMGPLGQLEHGLAEGIAVHRPPLPGFAVSEWTLGVGVNFRYRPLAYWIDDAIRHAIDDGRIPAIFRSHGLTFLPPER